MMALPGHCNTTVKARDEFWLKGQYYSLDDMMNNNPLAESFIGGIVYQTYVNGGADWHRFTAPIDGKVVAAEVVTGYAWTESDAAPPDPMSGPYSQGWAAGVATRALIYIDSGCKKLGTVCVVPIGLTEVSSVELFVKEGDSVKKGDQLGWFSFGGSSFAIVFQPGAIKEILVKPPENRNDQPIDTMRANKRCAIANID
jgi:phosphatidylserine decarboxylase